MEAKQKINNILWPNDFSKCSEKALPHVRSLAKQYGASVHVLYVAEDLAHHNSWYGNFDPTHIDRITEWEIKKAQDRQQAFCSRHLEECGAYTTHIEIGDPTTKILDFIEKEKATCSNCGYTADGRFNGNICPSCGLTYWQCSACGLLITAEGAAQCLSGMRRKLRICQRQLPLA